MARAASSTSWMAAGLALAWLPHAAAQLPSLKDAPVPGWPPLRIETHPIARIAMRGYCLPVPAGTPIPESPLNSCARPDFWRGVCDIYIDARYAGSKELLAHEERRCRGHDYRGSDAFAQAWRAWKAQGENRYADRLEFDAMKFLFEPPAKCDAESEACVEIR
jgi:hypothetical protein